jgi:cytochrome c oxidase cbb3-type subunit 3
MTITAGHDRPEVSMRTSLSAVAAAALFSGVPGGAAAQQPPPQRPREFPAHQRMLAAPEVIERGRTLYDIHCRLCHGPDLRGGDLGGVNLLRSQLVLNDQDGERILPVVKEGRFPPGMPPMPALPVPPEDVKAIASYIHSVLAKASRQGGPPPGPPVELNIVVGDAAAGQAYFAARCAGCHSVTGDLQGLATRYPEPMQLQNTWVAGRPGRGGRGDPAADTSPPDDAAREPRKPVTVVVTTRDGQRFAGRLERIDDFMVALALDDGSQRSFRRTGSDPQVQITDPLEGHKKLLVQYTDKDIHDVTAYLVTLK